MDFKALHKLYKKYKRLDKTLNYLLELQQEGMGEDQDRADLDVAIDVTIKLKYNTYNQLTNPQV